MQDLKQPTTVVLTMNLTRGTCYLCSSYTTKILQTSDTEVFYKELYNLLGAENLQESEFQKWRQSIKLCPLCCFSIASASQWKKELTINENNEDGLQNCCFLCRCNKFLIKVDSDWKYLKECLHCLSYDWIQSSHLGEGNICMSCFQKIDFAYKTKNKLIAKYPKLKVLQSPTTTKAQKKSRHSDLLQDQTPEIAPQNKVNSDVKDVAGSLESVTGENKRRKTSHKIEKDQLKEAKPPSCPNLNRMLCHLKSLNSDLSYQNIKNKYNDQLLMKHIPYVLINSERSKNSRFSPKIRLSNKVKKRVSFKLDVIDIIPDDVIDLRLDDAQLEESNQYQLSKANSNTSDNSDSSTNRVTSSDSFLKIEDNLSHKQVSKRKKRHSLEANARLMSPDSSLSTENNDVIVLNESSNNSKKVTHHKTKREAIGALKTKRKIVIDGNSPDVERNKKLKTASDSSSKSKRSFRSAESSSKSTEPSVESTKTDSEPSSSMTITKINSERSPFAFKIKFKKEAKEKYKPGPKSRKKADFMKKIEDFGFTNNVVINLEKMNLEKYIKIEEVESPMIDLGEERDDDDSVIDGTQVVQDGDRKRRSIDIRNKKHKKEINEIAKKYLEPTDGDIFSDTESTVGNNSSKLDLTNNDEEHIETDVKIENSKEAGNLGTVTDTSENNESEAMLTENDKNTPDDESIGTQKSDENLNEKLTSDCIQTSLNATGEELSASTDEIKLCSEELDYKNGNSERNVVFTSNQDDFIISDPAENDLESTDYNKVVSSGQEVDNSNDCDDSRADDIEPPVENKSSNSILVDVCDTDTISNVATSKYSNGNSDPIDEFKVPKGKSLLEEISDFDSDDTLTLQETIDLDSCPEGCQSISDDSPNSEGAGAVIIGKNKFITVPNSEKEDLDLHPNSELVLKCDVNTKTPSVSPTAELIQDPGDEFFNSLLGLESLDVDRIDENQPIVDKNLTPCQAIDESKSCDLKDKTNIKSGKKRVKSPMRTIQTPTN